MSAPGTPLHLQRQPWHAGAAADLPAGTTLLGALVYGAAPPAVAGPGGALGADDAAAGITHVAAPGLALPGAVGAAPALADLWLTRSADVRTGRTGRVHWRCDGRWMFGWADCHAADEAEAGGLQALAQQCYADVFAAQQAAGCPHLQRLWNYLPQINADGGGLERYRQFNSGRQQAFVQAGVAAFEGAPAACALGLPLGGGGMALRFLAGGTPPRAIENPRQVSAYRYPADYGPRAPTFSRAALAALGAGQVALFISGTASIVGHASVHPGDVAAQLHETLRNLQAVIDAAHAHTSARFALADCIPVVYVRHASHTAQVQAVLQAALGTHSAFVRQAVWLQADVCRTELLVEIEAHACAPGHLLGAPPAPR